MTYVVEILDSSRNPIAQIKNLVPINQRGTVLRFRKVLSNWGSCLFRVQSRDPVLSSNILEPWKYGVRIKRNNAVIFQGIIINNPRRNSEFIEVEARTYLYRLDKLFVKRDAATAAEPYKDNYRTFDSGTMKAAVEAVLSEGKAAVNTGDVLKSFTNGTIENPDFPNYFTKGDGSALTGGWTFSSDMTLQFDYKSILYVLKAFGIYANADFEVTNDLVFNFKKYIGVKQPELVFEYSNYGSIVDYDVPLNGERMTNDLLGIAVDVENKILHFNKRDEASVKNYLLMQDVAAFLDVKDKNALRARIIEELPFVAQPDSTINAVLNEKAYPLGQYDVGDTITLKIKDGIIDVNQQRRVVGISVEVHHTGTELITLQTNLPRDDQ